MVRLGIIAVVAAVTFVVNFDAFQTNDLPAFHIIVVTAVGEGTLRSPFNLRREGYKKYTRL
jgi:hypothetical protein